MTVLQMTDHQAPPRAKNNDKTRNIRISKATWAAMSHECTDTGYDMMQLCDLMWRCYASLPLKERGRGGAQPDIEPNLVSRIIDILENPRNETEVALGNMLRNLAAHR